MEMRVNFHSNGALIFEFCHIDWPDAYGAYPDFKGHKGLTPPNDVELTGTG